MNEKEFFESLQPGDECTVAHTNLGGATKKLIFIGKLRTTMAEPIRPLYQFDNSSQHKGTVVEYPYPSNGSTSTYEEWKMVFENLTHRRNLERIKLWKDLV